MNKTEFVNALVMDFDGKYSKKDVHEMVTAVFDKVMHQISKGEGVQIIGFGNFGVKRREARVGRNPMTGEAVETPARIVPFFKPGKALKDAAE